MTRKRSQEKNALTYFVDTAFGLAASIKRQFVKLFWARSGRMRCCNYRLRAFTINGAMKFVRCAALLAVVLSIALLFGCGHKHRRPVASRSPRPRPQEPKAAPIGTVGTVFPITDALPPTVKSTIWRNWLRLTAPCPSTRG